MTQVDPNSIGAFVPILVIVIVAVGFAGVTILLSHFVGKRVYDPAKLAPYECGITPVGTARERFHTRFYLVAMLFIVFDIETVFFYPWAVIYRQLRLFGLAEMAVFVGILIIGYAWIWGKGALEWD